MPWVPSATVNSTLGGLRPRGAALATDAFFPFPDSIEVAAAAGVTAIVHPGGSLRDAEAVKAAARAEPDPPILLAGTTGSARASSTSPSQPAPPRGTSSSHHRAFRPTRSRHRQPGQAGRPRCSAGCG